MSQLEHHPWDAKGYGKGANADIDPDLLKNLPGVYRDALNMRPTSISGTTGGLNKIKGDQALYGATGVVSPAAYWLLAIVSVRDHVVEFWAPQDAPTQKPLIRIDGAIMAMSSRLPFTYNKPFQWDKSERKGGYVMTTDYVVPPMIWDIKDIVDNFSLSTGKYFDPVFNPNTVTINLTAPLDIPVFERLIDIGLGGGLSVGQVAYAMRYGNNDGDKTNWSLITQMISIPRYLDTPDDGTRIFPGSRLEGSAPATDIAGRYATSLVYRVNNLQGYDFIEFKRVEYTDGAGIQANGKSYLIARINIDPDEEDVRIFEDPIDSTMHELIPDDEEQVQLDFIRRAKGIRYFDNRVIIGNYEKQAKAIDLDFTEVGGLKMVPITKDLGTDGYSDPIHNTYHKSLARLERYGWGIEGYDGVGGKAFVVPVPGYENYQMPSRRTEKADDSDTFSDARCWATNEQHVVSPTFEAFEQGSRQKTATTPGVDIRVNATYGVLNPKYASDPVIDGHNLKINVFAGGQTYNPAGYAPKYHALGMLLYGVENIPEHIKAFSVVRTERAGVIVANGIGTYALTGADSTPLGSPDVSTKSLSRIFFWSSDVARGAVPESAMQDIIANPQDYEARFTPMGFWSEVFNYKTREWTGQGVIFQNGINVDMLSHMRMQWDDGTINPGQGTTGQQPPPGAPGANYLDFGVWRNDGDQGTGVFSGPDQGAKAIAITSVFPIAQSGGGINYRLQLAEPIYQHTTPDPYDFQGANTKKFHEPWYLVSIIRKSAIVSAGERNYVNTGAYIKRESKIGNISGQSGQRLRLVDERWEDVLAYLPSDIRYIWIITPGGEEQAYLCTTNVSGINTAQIQNDITNLGFHTMTDGTQVYGLYTVENVNGYYEVLPTSWGYQPPAGSGVFVRYSGAPIRVFGGDATISSSVCLHFDKRAMVTGTDITDDINDFQQQFFLGKTPFPFGGYAMNPNYKVLRSGTVVEQYPSVEPYSIRQLAILHDTENFAPIHICNDDKLYDAMYPKRNYVVRPNHWDASSGLSANGINVQYGIDYPDEISIWYAGGFKAAPKMNLDYARTKEPDAFSRGGSTAVEQTLFENGVTFSMKAPGGTQNIPGWKTFYSRNRYLVDDNSGPIKMFWSANGPAGDNLYLTAHSGTCLLLTNKNILSGISGEQITTQAVTTGVIQGQKWLSRTIGTPDEFCFFAAEGHAPAGDSHADSLFFPDKNNIWRLTGDRLIPIGSDKYLAVLLPMLRNSGPDSRQERAFGYYDPENKEYWLGVNRTRIINSGNETIDFEEQLLYAYGVRNNEWFGRYGYVFDGYVAHKEKTLGARFMATRTIGNAGYLMMGQPYTCYVDNVHAPAEGMRIEAIRHRVHSSTKPTQLKFGDQVGVLATQDEATYGIQWLDKIDGWEKNVPCSDTPPYDRVQGEYLTVRIVHTLAEAFRIMSTSLQFKTMK